MAPGTVIGGRFVLEFQAGAGGMGHVYRARDLETKKPVALKVLRGHDALDVERFEQEAAILAELHHPGVVRYVAHGIADTGQHWLAMEWLEGEDLAARLARRGLSVDETIALLASTADALASAHARGVVHRDLKPHNLLLPNGDVAHVKVVDFGIARVASELRRLTLTGTLLGTPGYVAPEQLQESGPLDPRTDVFSLGCVIFECLTGRPAFEGVHAMAALAKVLLEGAPSARVLRPDVPAPLDDLVQRMMAKRPDDRPRDGAAVRDELARVVADLADSPPSSPAQLSSRRPFPSSPASLGLSEQRLVSVVLAGNGQGTGLFDGGASAATLVSPGIVPDLPRLLEPYGARVELSGGSVLVATVWSNGDATDRAERAARCALALRSRAPQLRVAVVTGRGLVSARFVGGELIDRGVATLHATPPGVIRVDDATTGALGPRFVVRHAGSEAILDGVSAGPDVAQALLGKPAPCVGRERELTQLEALFRAAAREPAAAAVLVTGPPGAGKSRLLREIGDRLERGGERMQMLLGRGYSLAAGSPFAMIADAIRRAAGMRDGELLVSRRKKLAALVQKKLAGAAAARVTAFLGELSGTPFPDEQHEALAAARGSALLMGDSMRAAWEEWLAAECEDEPLVLALDDLHWADAATVRLVDGALRSLADRPFVVIALGRPEVHARVPALWEDRALQTMRLGALSRRASVELVRGALGATTDAELVTRVVERGGGNPFHLQELVRAVAAGRGDAFPASVLDAVEARLDAEGGEAKRVLRAASVFGERFSRDGVAALVGSDPRLIGEWLEQLATRELLTPCATDEGVFMFRHALVREAAYATLTDVDRTLGHRLAGEWLERAGASDAMTVAEHFRRGAQPERAGRWYHRAAEQALEASDLAAAIDRADKGLEHGASAEERGGMRLVQAEAHVWRGELALAEERGLEAAALLPCGGQGWFRAVAQVVIAAGKLGGFDRVEGWIDRAITVEPTPGAASARLVCLSQCASYLVFGGRYTAADRLMEMVDRALADPALQSAQTAALVHQARSIRANAAGDLGACLEGLGGALTAFERAGDRRNVCAMRQNLGFIYAELGDFARAEEENRTALAAADRMGLFDLVTLGLNNLGHVLAYRGQLAEARRLEQEAVNAFVRQGDPRMEGVARTYLAEIALFSGDVDSAEREARAAIEVLVAARPLQPFAGAVLSRALLQAGRAEEALRAAREAHALLEAHGAIEEGESMVRLVYAEALLGAGFPAEYARAIDAARSRLLARAARIGDPEWRRRFLADVPDNARTLALAGP
jgi:serine/threonine protein kinase/tetratricopeptide (TPR) repeat protein